MAIFSRKGFDCKKSPLYIVRVLNRFSFSFQGFLASRCVTMVLTFNAEILETTRLECDCVSACVCVCLCVYVGGWVSVSPVGCLVTRTLGQTRSHVDILVLKIKNMAYNTGPNKKSWVAILASCTGGRFVDHVVNTELHY